MGELILCNQMLAAMPYYFEEVSLNIYSLEELSYFIEHNVCLITEEFMSDELCGWIAEQLKQEELAKRLREVREGSGKLAEYVDCLLKEAGYCSAKSRAAIVAGLREMEQKPFYERIKIRADRYVENKKYVSGMYEYLRLLQMKELQGHPKEAGLIWHNLGTVYAHLFLFAEAIECFQNAFRLSGRQESLESALYAKACLEESGRPLEKPQTASLLEQYKEVLGDGRLIHFEENIKALAHSAGQAKAAVWMKQNLLYWQEDYRRQCL